MSYSTPNQSHTRQIMCLWQLFIIFIIISSQWCLRLHANILNTILGVPAECMHQNSAWPCKLSFSCWLQGGKHAKGCGNNKWLFSCCVASNDASTSTSSLVDSVISEYHRKAINLPKRTMMKRRDENDVYVGMAECGIPKILPNVLQKRIIGGQPANFAEYPWQVHIRIAEFQCGGVLVSNNMVATAAHCIQQAPLKDIAVFLGELDTQSWGSVEEPLPVEKHGVLIKIIHPRFKFRLTQPDRYDIALLKLAQPTGFSEHILPICLPQYPINLVGRKGFIAGWGKTEANFGYAGTNMLQVAVVPIINSQDCIRWHKSKQINIELFNEMFCAGHSDGHQDACLGDSGGPLIIRERGRYVLVGITSAGFGCGVDHQPGIYHNVQKTANWIQNVITRHA